MRLLDISIGCLENPFQSWTIEDFLTAITQWDVREKISDFRKSLAPFGALISDEHFGQVSLKSDKSTYPINSFE